MWHSRGCSVLMVATVLVAGWVETGRGQEAPPADTFRPAQNEDSPTKREEPAAPNASPYLLGVTVAPLQKGLHMHLKLEPDTGLMVVNVSGDSPAAVAGVRRFDILLKIDGQVVSSPLDLSSRLAQTKGTAVELELLRYGEPLKLTATPMTAPRVELRDLMSRSIPLGPQHLDALRRIYPGVIVPPGEEPLPEILNLSDAMRELRRQQAEIRELLDSDTAEQRRQLQETIDELKQQQIEIRKLLEALPKAE